MFQLRACFAVGVLALAACGDDNRNAADAAVDQQMIDAKVWMDAPPPTFDFSCTANTTAPSTAAAQITLSGTVQSVGSSGTSIAVTPVDGAAVVACVNGAVNCTLPVNQDGEDVTDAQGAWSIGPFNTGGAPQDDYLEMTATGQRTTYVYPAYPFVANQSMIPILTFDSSGETLLSNPLVGCDPAQAIIGLALVDCANMPITDSANVTITVKQGGTAVTGTNVIDLGSFQAEAAGTFLVCGVPANAATEVSATYMSTQLLPHEVKTVAGETTATLLVPGYPAP